MDLQQHYQTQLDHLVWLATTKGWWQQARQQAQELEACESGVWKGMAQAVRARLQEAKYRPDPNETWEWWK